MKTIHAVHEKNTWSLLALVNFAFVMCSSIQLPRKSVHLLPVHIHSSSTRRVPLLSGAANSVGFPSSVFPVFHSVMLLGYIPRLLSFQLLLVPPLLGALERFRTCCFALLCCSALLLRPLVVSPVYYPVSTVLCRLHMSSYSRLRCCPYRRLAANSSSNVKQQQSQVFARLFHKTASS